MMDYEIIVRKKENPLSDPNPIVIERDREQRELEWQDIEELVAAAKKRYLDGETPLEQVMAETIDALNESRISRLDFLETYDPSEALIQEDLKQRREEDREGIIDLFDKPKI